jgi:16S rRNA (cytosine967-C5)-methyltransferase
MTDVPGLAARRAALKMCDAVLRRGDTLDQAAGGAMQHLRSGPDRALARAIAAEALRWLTDLDQLIDSATRQVLPDDSKPRAVLRLMLAQWLRLETPPHAVIATGLPLLAGGPRRLAHGVFSALVKQKAALPDAPTLPDRAIERLGDRATALAAALAEPPAVDFTLRDPATTQEWCERLGGQSLMPGHVRCTRSGAIENLPGFGEGAWWVQDLAASLPARLLGRGAGRVLDLCAAPGGKTLQLAAAGWDVTALDLSTKRLERVRENLARTGLSAAIVQVDALTWEPDAPFDAVLLDAPCTATGTCRRHPDVLHRIGHRQIEEMADLQARLLERAVRWVKPGGRLVYSTCSLEPEEGEAQLCAISLRIDPILSSELPQGLAVAPEGWLRIEPGQLGEAGGLDGFFMARWQV